MPLVLRCLFFLLLLAPQIVGAQVNRDNVYLTRDSLPYSLDDNLWRFTPADRPDGADPALDDLRWESISPRLRTHWNDSKNIFKGIGWLRFHFTADSSLASEPLAFSITDQSGASEVYLDGRLIQRYGRITQNSAGREYEDPHGIPLVLTLRGPGSHLLAVRYSNPDYRRNLRSYGEQNSGFSGMLYTTDEAGNALYAATASDFIPTVLLFSIFGTLALVHLLLFLYYRAEKSNGRFALFAGSLSLQFLLLVFMNLPVDPVWIMQLGWTQKLLTAVTALSLSSMLNKLFSRRKWHFYIVLAVCALNIAVLLLCPRYWVFAALGIAVLVPGEALIILARAVWQRAPGARIIGLGLLTLILVMLLGLIMVLVQGDVYIGDGSVAGDTLGFLLNLAILSIPISMSAYLAWRFGSVSRNLKAQLVQVETLSARSREQDAEKQRLLETRQEELETEVAARTEELRGQKKKSDDLLLNILPEEVAEELKETGRSVARLYNEVSVLFTDFVDFTQMSEHLSPSALVAEIDMCFQTFDGITERHNLEKIKTVGDAYIAVCGLPVSNADHARSVVQAALEIRDFMVERKAANPLAFGIRLGVHSGPVVAGIVGLKKFAYDIWGDTVNTAARMEQHSEAGQVNVSAATYELVKSSFTCSYRGEVEAKHKGKMAMYFAEKREG